MPVLYLLTLLSLALCHTNKKQIPANSLFPATNPYTSIAAIPLPGGYKRVAADTGSFAYWLGQRPLKKNKTVYLYNAVPKANQYAQFAVLNIPVGNKDLQQCADAVMRLRAEYLYERRRFDDIDFTDNANTHYRLPASASRVVFEQYLEKVFASCGTASLEKQLVPVNNFLQIAAGDVLIKGGSPGHAMLVMDVAENAAGKKIYLLAQSYMPAQDIHVVVNTGNPVLSPWYAAGTNPLIETPEWIFAQHHLRKWPKH
jgi:hypothetical protein